MALFRWPSWDPFSAMRLMQREVDRYFGRNYATAQRVGGGSYPPVNVFNGPDDMVVQCEMAGVPRDQVDLSITGETLVIRGKKGGPTDDEENVRYLMHERGAGEFQRTIVLPDRVDPDRIEATLTDGVLTIRLAKSESAKPKQISVK